MLAALALRRAVIELLTGKTLAGVFVYDTRLDQIDPTDIRDHRPVVSVYTEEDEAKSYSTREIYPNDTAITVVVETMVLSSVQMTVQNGDGTSSIVNVADIADSDAVTEALLDIMSHQIRRRMACKDVDQQTQAYAAIAMQVLDVRSYPQRTEDKSTRIAARSIHFRVKVLTDKDAEVAGTLPEPLATVAAKLTLPSSAAIIGQVADKLVSPTKPAALDGISLVTTPEGGSQTITSAIDTTL